MTTIPTTTPIAAEQRPPTAAPSLSTGDTLRVQAWRDPIVEDTPGAIRTDTEEALVWFTPSVGTISMAMAYRFARHAQAGPSVFQP